MHRVLKTLDTGLKYPDGKKPIILKFTDQAINTMDDGFGFFISQFAYLQAKIYSAKYTNIRYQEFIPIDTSAPEYVDSVDYVSTDAVGVAGFNSTNADDVPEVKIQNNKSQIPVFEGKVGYSYSLRELQKSQALCIPLDAKYATEARRMYEEGAQRVAFFGDTARSITGLLNNAAINSVPSTLDWSTATGQQIADDINSSINQVYNDSAQTHLPNRVLLGWKRYAYILNTPFNTFSTDMTILKYVKQHNAYTAATGLELNVDQCLQLDKLDVSPNVDRMVVYEKNDDNLTMQMPMPYKSLAPQQVNTRIKVVSTYVYGGVEFRYLSSALYKDFSIAPPSLV
jgi:hypothetical protein